MTRVPRDIARRNSCWCSTEWLRTRLASTVTVVAQKCFFSPWIFNFSMDYPTLFHFPWIQQGFSNGFFDSNCSGNFCRDDAVMEVSPALPNDPIETWVSCHYPIGSTYLGYTVVLNLSNTHVISCNQTWSTSTSMEKQVATSDQK